MVVDSMVVEQRSRADGMGLQEGLRLRELVQGDQYRERWFTLRRSLAQLNFLTDDWHILVQYVANLLSFRRMCSSVRK